MFKHVKKIFAYVLILAVLAALVPAGSMAEENDAAPEMQSFIKKMTALGVMDKNVKIEENRNVTRIEFINMVMGILGIDLSGVANTDMSPFIDVDEDYIYAPQIRYFYDAGWMTGYSDGRFFPDADLEFNQAVKVIVNILGYGVLAEQNGGYPGGYLSVADEIKVLDGVASGSGRITFDTMLKLIDNALKTELYSMKFNGVTAEYDIDENETLLKKYHDIYVSKGVVTGTYITSLTGDNYGVNQGQIMIDKFRFESEMENSDDYLGYHVEYYFKDTTRGNVLMYMQPTNKNTLIEVSAQKILSDDSLVHDRCFVYEDAGGKRKVQKLYDDTFVIYNGKALPLYGKEHFNVKTGFVKLLDNDSDSQIDCMFIFKAEDAAVISSFGSDGEKTYIFDKTDSEHVITLEDNTQNDKYIIKKDGQTVTLSLLAEDDVILVGTAGDGSYKMIYAGGSKVEGIVKSIDVDEEKILIDDSWFDTGEFMKKAEESENKWTVTPQINVSGVFYIDCFGYVQGMTKSTKGVLRYGYLMKTYVDENEELYMLSVLYSGYEKERYNLAERVKLNGTKMKRDAVIKNLENALRGEDGTLYDKGRAAYMAAGGREVMQLIQYKLDDNDYITEINTVSPKEGISFEAEYVSTEYWSFYYKWNFASQYYVTADTYNFIINTDAELSYVRLGDFKVPASGQYTVYIYNLGEDRTIDALIMIENTSSANYGEAIAGCPRLEIIKSRNSFLDEDDMEAAGLVCYDGTKETTIAKYDKMPAGTKSNFDMLDKGDMIFHVNDSSGRVSSIIPVFDMDKIETFGQRKYSEQTGDKASDSFIHGIYEYNTPQIECRVTYAQVEKKVGQYMLYHSQPEHKEGATRVQLVPSVTFPVTIMETGNKITLSNGTYKDIMPGDKVIWVSKYSEVQQMILIRN